jgi:Protein of unknown function (DUF3363)
MAGELSNNLGKPLVHAETGARIEVKVAYRIDLASGRFVPVEKNPELTLVPWRTALEKQISKQASDFMRTEDMNRRLGRSRGGPEIS